MHGLVNRALQRFVCDTYGDARWAEIASTAALGFDRFEPMLSYDPTITDMVIKAACFELGKPRGTLLFHAYFKSLRHTFQLTAVSGSQAAERLHTQASKNLQPHPTPPPQDCRDLDLTALFPI